MANKFVETALSDRGIEQAIVALKKGAHLLKCGRSGKPKFCPFRLSMDEKVLIWYSGEKEKHLKLNIVSKVVLGQKTVNFHRQHQPEKESRSFSLLYKNSVRSLDVICKDKEQAESWFLGLMVLVSTHHPRPLGNQKNTRGVHSCAGSPVAHLKRKHQIGYLQDSVKLSQVRSLYGSPRSLIDQYLPHNVSYSSDIFYSSRERTPPLFEKFLPHLPYVISDFSKSTRYPDVMKEQIMNWTSKISLSDHGTSETQRTDTLKDVFVWGEGIEGMLGGGFNKCESYVSKSDALLPKLLDSTKILDVRSISCGEKHAALITKEGEVFSWGKEDGGRLGHKVNMDVPSPKLIESLCRVCVQTVACGARHTCAVTSDGELYAWGDSGHGVRLSGDGCKRSGWFPQRIFGPYDGVCISRVVCGEWHTVVLSSSGQLFTYGDGTFGVLGHGDLQSVHHPKEVESLKGLRVKSIACGPWHTAAIVEITVGHLKSNTPCGKLFTWGDNDRGRLGHLDKDRKLLPTCVASLVDCDFLQVLCGSILTVALTVGGIIFTMGSSVNGQLGNPRAEDTSITSVGGALEREFVKEIASGSFHVAALTTNGRVFTWGKGANGRLGLGDTNDRDSPALVEALEDRNVQSISCGSGFMAVVCSHKSISSKEQAVCSGCGTAFGITRKKHNCYNCGLIFCHSCSSKKATNASLALNKSKKCRVCDGCFAQIIEFVDPTPNEGVATPRLPLITRKGLSDLKMDVEESYPWTKAFIPKIYSDNGKLVEGSTMSMQGGKGHNQDSSLMLGSTQRWGQVPLPLLFDARSRESSLMFGPRHEVLSNTYRDHSQISPTVTKFMLPRAPSRKNDSSRMDKMLIEELQRLQSEAMILSQECQSNSQKLQQDKCRVEETWSLAREEAAKCKAAKDVIKVLKDQINTLSQNISSGRDKNNTSTIPESKLADGRESDEPVEAKLCSSNISCDLRQINGPCHRSTQSFDGMNRGSKTNRNQSGTRSIDGTLENAKTTGEHAPRTTRDEWVEQEERGVYITLIALPSGEKGLKRVRFSRKHFGAEEAERWWEENQRRIYLKYNVEGTPTSAKY